NRSDANQRARRRYAYGQTRRRDAGVGPGGFDLHQSARGTPRDESGFYSQARSARAYSGRRNSQRWAIGRHYYRRGDGFSLDTRAGAQKRRDDRRDHSAWARAANRWRERKAFGCSSLWHRHDSLAERQREGSSG